MGGRGSQRMYFPHVEGTQPGVEQGEGGAHFPDWMIRLHAWIRVWCGFLGRPPRYLFSFFPGVPLQIHIKSLQYLYQGIIYFYFPFVRPRPCSVRKTNKIAVWYGFMGDPPKFTQYFYPKQGSAMNIEANSIHSKKIHKVPPKNLQHTAYVPKKGRDSEHAQPPPHHNPKWGGFLAVGTNTSFTHAWLGG